ncbi:uncharacterized protein LOC34618461 [Cyclospora cayetanensis]|uniref:Uncharacterized protein LOC34618461 n=1 Tax=Cyclospora cayetanensis TaxID=88456 RepID=A0A6P5WCX1_9EIME|nr:uncharacterized protein LOC34618461 [Cyclospora cayetanensis]
MRSFPILGPALIELARNEPVLTLRSHRFVRIRSTARAAAAALVSAAATAAAAGQTAPPCARRSRPYSAGATTTNETLENHFSLIAATVSLGPGRLSGELQATREEGLKPYARVLQRLDRDRDGVLSLRETARLIRVTLGEATDIPITATYVKRLLASLRIPLSTPKHHGPLQQHQETLALPQVMRLLQLTAGSHTVSSAAVDGLLALDAVSFALQQEAPSWHALYETATASAEAEIRLHVTNLVNEYALEASQVYAEGIPYLRALLKHSAPLREKLLENLGHQLAAKEPLPRLAPSEALIRVKATAHLQEIVPQLVMEMSTGISQNMNKHSTSTQHGVSVEAIEMMLARLVRQAEAFFLFAVTDADGNGSLDMSEFLSVLLVQQLHMQQLVQAAVAPQHQSIPVMETPWVGELAAGWLEAPQLRQQQMPFVSRMLFTAADVDQDSRIPYEEFLSFLDQQDLLVSTAVQLFNARAAVLYL